MNKDLFPIFLQVVTNYHYTIQGRRGNNLENLEMMKKQRTRKGALQDFSPSQIKY